MIDEEYLVIHQARTNEKSQNQIDEAKAVLL